jgi:hypothetical protein
VEVEPWAEAVDGAELLNALARWIRRYVVLEEAAVETLALWVHSEERSQSDARGDDSVARTTGREIPRAGCWRGEK